MPRFEKSTVPPTIPEIRPVYSHPDFIGSRGPNGTKAGYCYGTSGSFDRCWLVWSSRWNTPLNSYTKRSTHCSIFWILLLCRCRRIDDTNLEQFESVRTMGGIPSAGHARWRADMARVPRALDWSITARMESSRYGRSTTRTNRW